MSLWLECEIEPAAELEEQYRPLFEKTVAEVLKTEQIETPVEVSLTLTSPDEIQRLNREFRDIDRVTDVLSFPQYDYPEAGAAAEVLREASESADANPETGEVFLGDIVICLDRAKEQSDEYGHSLERELGFLTAHSMLHLLGYDHMTEDEEKIMFGKQEEVLTNLGLPRIR